LAANAATFSLLTQFSRLLELIWASPSGKPDRLTQVVSAFFVALFLKRSGAERPENL
jgi:hypothetical protein